MFAAPLLAFLVAGTSAQAQDADPAVQAHQHYQAGVSLFEAGNKEQALVEFQLANELVPKKANLFMIAQCQYHLGLLKEARANYQEFLAQPTSEELADIARLRIEAINHRPGVLAINTVPDQVQVRIEGGGQVFTGEAPNEFRVPRGRYRVTVSKPNFVRQERDITIDVAETKPLFFKLDPIPARLEVHTSPSNATLYVRGNRTQNPYAQFVDPGDYEIYAEANYHIARHDVVSLAPGQQLKVDFPLSYLQRSGRPELIGFWIGIGFLFLRFFEKLSWVIVLALLIPVADTLSVWRGPTHYVVTQKPQVFDVSSVAFPVPGERTVTIRWQAPTASTVSGWHIFRRVGDARERLLVPDPFCPAAARCGKKPAFSDGAEPSGKKLRYRIVAIRAGAQFNVATVEFPPAGKGLPVLGQNTSEIAPSDLRVASAPTSAGLGLPDVLFFSLFLGAAARFGLRRRATWLALVASLGATTLLAVYADPFKTSGLPALPGISLAFLLVNADLLWRRFRGGEEVDADLPPQARQGS